MNKIIKKKPCNVLHMKVLVKNASYGTCTFFTQNNHNNLGGNHIMLRTICITVFFPTF